MEFQDRIFFQPCFIQTDGSFINSGWIFIRNIRRIDRKRIQYICIVHPVIPTQLPHGRYIDLIPAFLRSRLFESFRRKFRCIQIQKRPLSVQTHSFLGVSVKRSSGISSADSGYLIVFPSFHCFSYHSILSSLLYLTLANTSTYFIQ